MKDRHAIPHKYVTEAALALCTKLRKELDEQKSLVKALEIKSNYPNVSIPATTSSLLLNDFYKPSKSYNVTSSSYDNILLRKYK